MRPSDGRPSGARPLPNSTGQASDRAVAMQAARRGHAGNGSSGNGNSGNGNSGGNPTGNSGNRTPRDGTFIDRQLRQRKRARIWRGFAVFSLLCLAGAITYSLTPHGRDTGKVVRDAANMAFTAKTNPNLIFDHAGSNNVNILLIGRDVNWKMGDVYDPTTKQMRPFYVIDKEASARSDTMIVVTLDNRRNVVRMVSFPRDAIVRLAPNDVDDGPTKLNAAHAYGGPELLMRTMREQLGLTIHHYAIIQFDGFKKLIDQVGGIEVDVIGALQRDGSRGRLKYNDHKGNLHIDLQPGRQWLDGEAAHSYVRFRMDIEGDPGRIRRQQQVMRALAKSIMSQPFYKVPGLVQEVRRQFKTTLTDEEIASAASFAHSIGDSAQIQPITLYGTYGGSRGSLILNEPKNKQLLSYIFGSTFNPDLFLHRSPTTRRYDVGGEDTPNPATHALLREAGLIEGEAPLRSASDSSTRRTNRSSALAAEPRSLRVQSYDLPVLKAEAEAPRSVVQRRVTREPEPVIPDLSVEAPSSPRRILREETRRSEPSTPGNNTLSTPRRETARSETSRNELPQPATRDLATAPVAETPPVSEAPTAARRPARQPVETPSATRDLSVESPVPMAETGAAAAD